MTFLKKKSPPKIERCLSIYLPADYLLLKLYANKIASPIVTQVIIEIVSMEIPLFICVFSFSHEKKNNNVIKRHTDSNFLFINVFVWFLNIYSKKYTGFVDFKNVVFQEFFDCF